MTRNIRASGSVSAAVLATFVLSGCVGNSGGGNDNPPNDAGVIGAPSLQFSADTSELAQTGMVSLIWLATDATECDADLDWSGARPLGGTEDIGPVTQDSAFRLMCSGDGGTTTRQINVIAPANPPEDPPAEDPPEDPPGGGGNPPPTPPPAGDPEPTVQISTADSLVDPGDSTTVSWSSSNASSCSAAGGWTNKTGTSGSDSVGPLSFTTAFEITCTGSGGSNTAAVTVSVQNQQATDVVASFDVQDSGSGNGRAITFGVPLAEGAVNPTTDLVVTETDGTVLASQWNPLATWKTDGSVMHGALTVVMPASGNNSGSYQVRVGTQTGGAGISKSDVVAAGFDAEIKVRLGGTNYSLSAADLLDGTVTPRQDYTHFAGPLASEFIVGGPLRVGGTGNEHNTVQGYFHVRAFGRPVQRVYVTSILENTGTFKALSNVTGDVTLTVGGATEYTNSGFSIDADKRYPRRAWWNGDTGLWVGLDTEYVQDTRLVPEYREDRVSESMLSGFPRSVEWSTRGQLSAALESGGAAAHIGPYDRWSAAYLMTGDRRAFDAMRAHGDVYHWTVSSHDYAMNPRDESTGFPLDLADNPNVVGAGWGGIPAKRQSTSPVRTDMAHQPSCNYVLYLVTAEYGALEQCQFWGVANWIMERPGSYAGWPRSYRAGQVRGLGWGFRNIANAAVATPDNHPLKQTLMNAVVFALDSMNTDLRGLPGAENTGLILTGPNVAQAIVYNSSSTPNPNDSGGFATGLALWMDNYLTWAVGSAYERGFRAEMDSSGVWNWKSKAIVGSLGTTGGYCWTQAATYTLGVIDNPGGAKYSSWANIYAKNFPSAGTCPATGTTSFAGGSDQFPGHRGGQMAPAISVAASTGIPGANAAYDRFEQRDYNWGGQTWGSQPEWAIKKRD
ncbi:MAG: hypothetical protein ACR2QB_02570 [Gammaproteobacteria bacterium]